jgi:hypothetical protein
MGNGIIFKMERLVPVDETMKITDWTLQRATRGG